MDVLLGQRAHVPAADQTVIVWEQTGLTASDFSPAASGASEAAAAPSIDTLVASAPQDVTG